MLALAMLTRLALLFAVVGLTRLTAPLLNVIGAVVLQIALLDVVFSLDSVFTAVGLARPDQLPSMAAAIVLSIPVMMRLSGPIAPCVAHRAPCVARYRRAAGSGRRRQLCR